MSGLVKDVLSTMWGRRGILIHHIIHAEVDYLMNVYLLFMIIILHVYCLLSNVHVVQPEK